MNYPLDRAASHARVVLDNHYGLRFERPTPNFLIQELTNCSTMRIIFSDNSPIVSGVHYLVEHTHAIQITNETDLHLLHVQICWDITLLTKILNDIPLQFKRACEVLSKEIAADQSFKTFLELRMSTPPSPLSTPPASDLNFTPDELALLEKDLPKDSQNAFFS